VAYLDQAPVELSAKADALRDHATTISRLRRRLESKHNGEPMNKHQVFQSAARENGYTEANVYGGGSAVWFRKATPDQGTEVHRRLCIDSITGSATVFWQTVPAKLNSKTFRSVSSLKAWFDLKSEGRLD
jgi:hypothetical protein